MYRFKILPYFFYASALMAIDAERIRRRRLLHAFALAAVIGDQNARK